MADATTTECFACHGKGYIYGDAHGYVGAWGCGACNGRGTLPRRATTPQQQEDGNDA